ncbi:MAG TPA: hypothetical protein VFB60_15800 [Ktedonobacteraceae bacterium]|nr:hypothetical protein [Ktedonobacteraceae bacterium]
MAQTLHTGDASLGVFPLPSRCARCWVYAWPWVWSLWTLPTCCSRPRIWLPRLTVPAFRRAAHVGAALALATLLARIREEIPMTGYQSFCQFPLLETAWIIVLTYSNMFIHTMAAYL